MKRQRSNATRSGPDQDWAVTRVRRVNAELSARGAVECMSQDDFIEMERLANAADGEP